MEAYRHKTPLATAANRLLLRLLVVGAGVFWFVMLWGLTLPALTAGFAFGCLLWLSVRRFEAMSIQRKEAQLRRAIGGEMAVDRLLLLPDRHGAFQAALWLAQKAPLEMQRTTPGGVLCRHRQEPLLVRLIAQHKSLPVTVQQVIDAQKEAMAAKAQRLVLCCTTTVSKEGVAYAETAAPPIKLLTREELVRLAGQYHPATDEELQGLGARKGKRLGWRRWADHVLAPGRARGYFLYGLGLTVLALVTGFAYYPIPAVICLGLCIACRCYRPQKEEGYL